MARDTEGYGMSKKHPYATGIWCPQRSRAAQTEHSCKTSAPSAIWPRQPRNSHPFRGARLSTPPSEEVGLLHDAQELLLVHLAVAVAVGLVDHLPELLVRHALSQLLGHTLQVLERNLAGLVIVEQPEGLQDLVLRVAVQDLVRHHLQELLVADRSAAVVVDVGDHLLDLLFLRLEAEGAHRDLQLLGVDLAGAIGVEEVEGLLDLLLLLLGQLLLLLAAGVETTQGHLAGDEGTGEGVSAMAVASGREGSCGARARSLEPH